MILPLHAVRHSHAYTLSPIDHQAKNGSSAVDKLLKDVFFQLIELRNVIQEVKQYLVNNQIDLNEIFGAIDTDNDGKLV